MSSIIRTVTGYTDPRSSSRYRQHARRRYKRLDYQTSDKKKKELAKLISKIMEEKSINKHFRNLGIIGNFDSNLTGPGDAIFLLNGITKGTDDYQRIGDVIYLKQINVKGCVTIPGYLGDVAYLSYVTVMMLACKSAPQASSTTMPWTSLLTQNGAYNGWTGTIINRLQDINTDDFELLYRQDIPLAQIFHSTAGTIATAVMGVSPGGTTLYAEFNVTKNFARRKVVYEAGLNTPAVFNPFICFCVTQGDAAITGVSGQTVNVVAASDITFQDTMA